MVSVGISQNLSHYSGFGSRNWEETACIERKCTTAAYSRNFYIMWLHAREAHLWRPPLVTRRSSSPIICTELTCSRSAPDDAARFASCIPLTANQQKVVAIHATRLTRRRAFSDRSVRVRWRAVPDVCALYGSARVRMAVRVREARTRCETRGAGNGEEMKKKTARCIPCPNYQHLRSCWFLT
jgi:hypothetical protein